MSNEMVPLRQVHRQTPGHFVVGCALAIDIARRVAPGTCGHVATKQARGAPVVTV